MSLSILVLAYNCEIDQSRTIRSILSVPLDFSGIRLCIWNNGPSFFLSSKTVLDALEAKGFEVTVQQTIENAPLSCIYNFFIRNYCAENYVILDHDSDLTVEYIEYVLGVGDNFVGMPIIQVGGKPQSPCVNGKYFSGPYTGREFVTAIGSGLVINREVVQKLLIDYGNVFDENFALYGVDTSFFCRIYESGLSKRLRAIPGFNHSLSRLEVECGNIKRFREIERSYDLGLMLRHYPSVRLVMSLLKQVVLWPLGKKKIHLYRLLKVFILGRHERCYMGDIEKIIRKTVQ